MNKNVLGLIILLIAILTGLFIGCKWEQETDYRVYNGGACNCGGKYKFSSCTYIKNNSLYYYTCDSCDRTIETHRLMK